jgi:hypothetical protein
MALNKIRETEPITVEQSNPSKLQVSANKSGTWDIDNLLNPHPVLVKREGKIIYFYITSPGPGEQIIYTPSPGYRAKVIAWNFYLNADAIIEMRFQMSKNLIAGLPAKGVSSMNLIGTEAPTGNIDEPIVIYVDRAVNVKGWISVVEV